MTWVSSLSDQDDAGITGKKEYSQWQEEIDLVLDTLKFEITVGPYNYNNLSEDMD